MNELRFELQVMEGGGGGEEEERKRPIRVGPEEQLQPKFQSPHKGSYNSCQFLYHPLLPGIPHVTTLTHGTGKELCF